MARLQDLPPEILIDIAELVQNSPPSFSSSSYCSQAQPTSSTAASLWACSSLCRILRAVFRPYAWARVNIPHNHTTGFSGGLGGGRVQLSPDQNFLRSLSKFHSLLVAYPEIGGYVKELGVYLPTGGGSDSTGSSGSGAGFGAAGFLRWGSTSSSSSSSSEAEDHGLSEHHEEGWQGSEEWDGVFPSLVKRLTRVRKVKVVSYQCHSSEPPPTPPRRSPGFRVDWDVLSPSLRTGFETLFALETLSEVELMGVVVPPRMLFGLPPSPPSPPTHAGGNVVYSGPGSSSSSNTSGISSGNSRRNSTRTRTKLLRNLRRLVLVAHCPMSPKRLEQIDGMGSSSFGAPGFTFASSSSPSHSSSPDVYPLVRNTYPINTIYPATDTDSSDPDSDSDTALSPTIRSLTLGYCDSTFLRYITRYYPGAFSSLTRLTLNVIERDLPFCQFFLDQGLTSSSTPSSSSSSSPSSSFSATSSLSTLAIQGRSGTATARYCPLEEFDLTIRCNTAPSFFGHLFDIHSLNFSSCCALPNPFDDEALPEAEYDAAGQRRGGGLKKLTLRYLLLSQVTEAVCRAVEGSVGSALGVRLDDDNNASAIGGAGGWGTPVTAGLGSTLEELHIVIDWAYNGDAILLDMLGRLDRMVEASCSRSWQARPQQIFDDSRFRHHATTVSSSTHRLRKFTFEAMHWPCVPPPAGSGITGGANTSQCALRNLALGPGQQQLESTSAYAQTTLEGNLDKSFPFLCRARALGQVEFESRFTLEARSGLAGVQGCL